MNKHPKHSLGFVLIEALVALLVVAFAALAISKITTVVLSSAGDSRARAEALLLAEGALEQLRNNLTQAQYASALPASATNSATVAGATASFTVATTITTPVTGSLQRLLQVSVSWTSSANESLSVNLSSEVAWDNAENQAATQGGGLAQTTINPRGAARRITKDYGTTLPTGASSVDGSDNKAYIKKTGNVSELIVKVGSKYIGTLETTGDFSKIQGNVYFDPAANQLPNMNTFDLRLSSEGECVYNSDSSSATVAANSKTFAYFGYTCFVGTGWYGNVGLSSRDTTGKAFQTCVGDPGFAAVAKLTSPHGDLSPIRTYRGFELVGSSYLSTGMANNSYYPNSVTDSTTIYGKPTPSDYGYTATGLNNQFNQHFFVTSISGQSTCQSKMPTALFAKNAGKFLCISPDNTTATDQCPDVWPNFEGYVAGGGTGGGGGGGGGGTTCVTVVSGSIPSAYKTKGVVTISPASTASCTISGNQQSYSYSCTNITSAQTTPLTITLTDTSNNNASQTLTSANANPPLTANCTSNTFNF